MNQVINQLLKNFDVHLASSSPRRKAIFEQVGFKFTVTPSTFEENLDKSLFKHPKDFVLETARCKAVEVMERLKNQDAKRSRFVISTDTVVVAEDKILEKPHTHEVALEMLTKLNAVKSHQVYCGVTLLKYDGEREEVHQFYDVTNVEFGDLSHEVIKLYADSKEPLDKAGAYGIQGVGATLIKSIDGCYYNVMGFPLYKFCQETHKWLN